MIGLLLAAPGGGELAFDAEMRLWLGLALAAYLALVFALAFVARGRISTTEDFVVAGRRLGPWMATATLLATWFGAGTLMTAADEVRANGVRAATLDPIGAGFCLLIAGLVFAPRLWREKLITVPELFERRYGRRERRLGGLLMVPTYLGWIAAQFTALAHLLELFFGIPLALGMVGVAAVGIAYTTMGGMWAVALTDALQIVIVIVGLLAIALAVFWQLGEGSVAEGLHRIEGGVEPALLDWVPEGGDLDPLAPWLGVLAAGALGNLASQDLFSRVFSARSEKAARFACLLAGGAYLSLGLIPVALGLAARVRWGPEGEATIAGLGAVFLHPLAAVGFLVTLCSVVLSTIDSALLAPAVVLVHDVFARARAPALALRRTRDAVIAVGVAALLLAFVGESAYALLESSYELGMVALLVPLSFAVFGRRFVPAAALVSMLGGTGVWLLHQALGWENFADLAPALPTGLGCTALALALHLSITAARGRPEAASMQR